MAQNDDLWNRSAVAVAFKAATVGSNARRYDCLTEQLPKGEMTVFVCTFAGHREIRHSRVSGNVKLLIDVFLDQHDAVTFYNGGMGEFDKLCARLVNEAKAEHPDKSIAHLLVLPYLTQEVNKKAYYNAMFDKIIIARMPEGIHYKRAIQARNHWMADQADFVIAYLYRDFGGAYDMAAYAKKKEKG